MNALDRSDDIIHHFFIACDFDLFFLNLFELSTGADMRFCSFIRLKSSDSSHLKTAEGIFAELSTTCLTDCFAHFVGMVEWNKNDDLIIYHNYILNHHLLPGKRLKNH